MTNNRLSVLGSSITCTCHHCRTLAASAEADVSEELDQSKTSRLRLQHFAKGPDHMVTTAPQECAHVQKQRCLDQITVISVHELEEAE